MKSIFERTAALFTLGALCFSLFACGNTKREYTYICGEKIDFVTEKETEKWREPLERLLSNAEVMVPDGIGSDSVDYKAPNPDLPSVAYGYACALYDVNLDGVPELLVDLGGGSAGNSFYKVYDIYTGEEVCDIDGAQGASLCAYYYSETREVKNVNDYSWRVGWDTQLYFTTVFTPGTFEEKCYLYSIYRMDMVQSGENGFDTVCTSAEFEIWGKRSYSENFREEEMRFEKDCVRIKETELCYIYWWKVTEDEDTPEVKGEKMAEALLSSEQKFIFYEK